MIDKKEKKMKNKEYLRKNFETKQSQFDSPLARDWLRAVDLTEAEIQILWSGGFAIGQTRQFGIACTLCRRRSVLSDS